MVDLADRRILGQQRLLLPTKVRDIANQHAGTEQLREQIAYALAPHFERDAGPTPDYTGEGSAWVPPVEAAAVVVPDDDRPSREFLENYVEGFDPGERSAALFGWREGRRHLRENSRAIPADRVLGEGMVAVTPEYLDAAWGLDDMSDLEMFMWFRDNQEESGSDAQRVAKIFWREAQEWKKHQRKKFDALRASQGGGAA